MTNLHDLIARIEAAAGPDRELDAAISVAVGRGDHETHVIEYTDGRSQRVPWRPGGLLPDIECRSYTASIDSALTLVPEGWVWRVCSADPYCGHSQGYACLAAGTYVPPQEPWLEDRFIVDNRAATPVLALCAAALRAHLT